MNTLAAAAAPALGVGDHILGTLTASGLAAAATIVLIVGARGNVKWIKFKTPQVTAVAALITGIIYTSAAAVWHTPATAGAAAAASVQSNALGHWGAGGTALVLAVLMLVTKRHLFAGILGITAAGVFATAGGIWSILTSLLAGVINGWIS